MWPFPYYSSVGGNETSLNFMIDDVTFGRTDLPELSVDNDFIKFAFRSGQEMTPQPLNIYSDRTTAPVTITLTPSTQKKYFKLSHEKLPLEGGTMAVGFKSNDSKTHAAALLYPNTWSRAYHREAACTAYYGWYQQCYEW